MMHRDRVADIFRALTAACMNEAEVYLKTGRSRRLGLDLQGRVGGSSFERGWAIRAGGRRSSMFLAGTGLPMGDLAWPEPDGQPLRLPPKVAIPDWIPPPDLDLPLLAESEAGAFLGSIASALESELPGSRILRGFLEEGSSETSILNTHGLETHFRRRAANLFVEAVGPWPASPSCKLSLAERNHSSFQPAAVARRLANQLLLTRQSAAPIRARGEILLSSAVAARVLVSLLPMFMGRDGEMLARQIRNRPLDRQSAPS